MNYADKIIYGLDKIHYCLDDKNIKALKGALSIELRKVNKEIKLKKGNGYINLKRKIFLKGTLKILGLTLLEQAELFGYKYVDGELYVDDLVSSKKVRLFFSRNKATGGELYTIVYNCKLESIDIEALTQEEDIENSVLEINIEAYPDEEFNNTYFTLDTDYANPERSSKFFKEILKPLK